MDLPVVEGQEWKTNLTHYYNHPSKKHEAVNTKEILD